MSSQKGTQKHLNFLVHFFVAHFSIFCPSFFESFTHCIHVLSCICIFSTHLPSLSSHFHCISLSLFSFLLYSFIVLLTFCSSFFLFSMGSHSSVACGGQRPLSLAIRGSWQSEALGSRRLLAVRGLWQSVAPGGQRPLAVSGSWRSGAPEGQRLLVVRGSWWSGAPKGQRLLAVRSSWQSEVPGYWLLCSD